MLANDTHRIAESEAFIGFADAAHLGRAQRILVARTLALHFENDASIHVTAKTPEQASSMRHQLLGDTMAHLQIQIPEFSWDSFIQSGLLPEVAVSSINGRSR